MVKRICGFVPTSLVDWDGKISAVLFLPGCSFRCPWCYAADLVLRPHTLPAIPLGQIKRVLAEYHDWLDGVVITGGEPTMHEDLPELCAELKVLGYPLKLDTNGSNPEMLAKLLSAGLIDYVALDIKAPLTWAKYQRITGGRDALDQVKRTVKMLLGGKVDYEFRTTCVPTLHTATDIAAIGRAIKGAKKWALQNFMIPAPGKLIDRRFYKLKPFTPEQLLEFQQIAKKYVKNTIVRGI